MVDLLAKIRLILAVGYGELEYKDAAADEQRNFSFSMIEVWKSDRYREDFQSVAAWIDDIRTNFPTKYDALPRRKKLETSFVGDALLKEISPPIPIPKKTCAISMTIVPRRVFARCKRFAILC